MTDDVFVIDDNFGDDRSAQSTPVPYTDTLPDPVGEEAPGDIDDIRRAFRRSAVEVLVDVENTMRKALGSELLSDEVLVEVAQDGTVVNVYDAESVDAAHIPDTSTLIPRTEF